MSKSKKGMTGRERLIRALRCEEADRVPITPHFSREYVRFYINKTDEWIDAYISAYRRFGFDLMIQVGTNLISTWRVGNAFSFKNWECSPSIKERKPAYVTTESVIRTPQGELKQKMRKVRYPESTQVIDYFIKQPEDISLLKYRPDPHKHLDVTPFKIAQKKVGSDGLAYGVGCGSMAGRLRLAWAEEINNRSF